MAIKDLLNFLVHYTYKLYSSLYVLGLYDNGKAYISIMPIIHYNDNNSYRDKIMIGYYAYNLDFVISKLLCILTNVLCSIWKFTIITIINKKYYLYHDNELIISIINLSKLSYCPSMYSLQLFFTTVGQ